MEGSIALLLILGLVVGGMTLILAPAYAAAEKNRTRRSTAERPDTGRQAAELIAALPSFFSPTRPATPIAFVFDDGVVHLLEDHLKAEQDAVALFLREPSIDTLYRQPHRPAQEAQPSTLA